MDRIRVPTRRTKGGSWSATYLKRALPKVVARSAELTTAESADACARVCVSDLSCKAWKYTAGSDQCWTSALVDEPRAVVEGNWETVSGLVANEVDLTAAGSVVLPTLFVVGLVAMFFALRRLWKPRRRK
uniref:PAN-like domain protein n=1 Tax=Marseillevirus LCMAC103 TaxID=2506604 RepID=A0A481YVU3_9VIRU|nr:MAG: PAN-like domain protein [Marseillevirus LCMAC103]